MAGAGAVAATATAFGLLVAIPAVVAFNYFQRRLRVSLGTADVCAHTVLSLVHGKEPRPVEPMTSPSAEALDGRR